MVPAERAFGALRGGLLPLPGWLAAPHVPAIFGAVMPGRIGDLARVQEAARRGAFEWPAAVGQEAALLGDELDEASAYELAQIGRAIFAADRARAAYAARRKLEMSRPPRPRPSARRLPPGIPESERWLYEGAVAFGQALTDLSHARKGKGTT